MSTFNFFHIHDYVNEDGRLNHRRIAEYIKKLTPEQVNNHIEHILKEVYNYVLYEGKREKANEIIDALSMGGYELPPSS